MNSPESSSAIPRIYRPLSRAFGIAYGVWALCLLAGHWWPILSGARRPSPSDFIFLSGYLLMAAVFTFVTIRDCVRLSQESIEICRIWGSQILPFDKIEGRRRYAEKADPYSDPKRHLVLEPNDERYPRIDIRERRVFDEHFYRWFDSLPDLDKRDGIEVPKSKYDKFSLV